MKRILLFCFVLLVCMTACQKNVQHFTGDYSYKISGSVTVEGLIDEYDKMLTPRIGQMNIVRVNDSKTRVMITMNESGGRAYVCYGTVSGNRLTIEPYTFTAEVSLNATETGVYDVNAYGDGELTDDMLVIHQVWQGVKTTDEDVVFQGNDILIVAKQNS